MHLIRVMGPGRHIKAAADAIHLWDSEVCSIGVFFYT